LTSIHRKSPKPNLITTRKNFDVRVLRHRRKLKQADFWARVSVTQSGGSRFESGRKIPNPLCMLLTLAYGTDTQAQKLFEWLRNHQAD
jgi:DNA-binding transcriptional regulator YiaG